MNEENIIEKNIIIIICFRNHNNHIKEKKIENITNKTKVEEVKKIFADKVGINIDENKIRFFYKGFELLDENLLWYDKVENMAKIQCLVTQIENE